MATGMKIGIIGAGHLGASLARLAAARGCKVMISNSGTAESLQPLAASIPCAAASAKEAARCDVVFLGIPFKNIFSMDPSLFTGRILVDANNYYPDRDGKIARLDNRQATTSELVQEHFPSATVVKAFNAILARDLDIRQIALAPKRALPMAGDDGASKMAVADLHEKFGFDVVDAGTLQDSWRFERAKPAYCIPLGRLEMESALAQAQKHVELPHGSWRKPGH